MQLLYSINKQDTFCWLLSLTLCELKTKHNWICCQIWTKTFVEGFKPTNFLLTLELQNFLFYALKQKNCARINAKYKMLSVLKLFWPVSLVECSGRLLAKTFNSSQWYSVLLTSLRSTKGFYFSKFFFFYSYIIHRPLAWQFPSQTQFNRVLDLLAFAISIRCSIVRLWLSRLFYPKYFIFLC